MAHYDNPAPETKAVALPTYKTLAARGMCTIWFVAANNCYLSGAGLS